MMLGGDESEFLSREVRKTGSPKDRKSERSEVRSPKTKRTAVNGKRKPKAKRTTVNDKRSRRPEAQGNILRGIG